ncbi:MAG: hypothetical protein ACE5JU_11695 [Candidatus Binatia bacterium]
MQSKNLYIGGSPYFASCIFLGGEAFLNPEISRQGYGLAYARSPLKYLREFRRLEREARKQENSWRNRHLGNPVISD